jgi:hypothetical protein
MRSGSDDVHDASFLLLGDILPTGLFAALQLLQHQKIAPMLRGDAWPLNTWPFHPDSASPAYGKDMVSASPLCMEDRILTVAIVGLGPVGIVSASVTEERYFNYTENALF